MLLKKSFCTRYKNFFWLYTRLSCKDVGDLIAQIKLAGDLGNVIEATSIRRSSVRFFKQENWRRAIWDFSTTSTQLGHWSANFAVMHKATGVAGYAPYLNGFRQGLKTAADIEGQKYDRLPELAADLVGRKVMALLVDLVLPSPRGLISFASALRVGLCGEPGIAVSPLRLTSPHTPAARELRIAKRQAPWRQT